MATTLPPASARQASEAIQTPPAPNGEPQISAGLPPAPAARSSFIQQRLLSLDVYRGLIMITLAFNGFGLARTAQLHLAQEPQAQVWQNVHYHFEHVEWTGCGYWDLIQPSFMFMVGVAMAFSYAKRQQQGATYGQMLRHAIGRSLILIFLGIFLISNGQPHTTWSLMNVLTQIGLGYTFLFLLWDKPVRTQAIVAVAILVAVWLLYVLYPTPGIDLVKGAPEYKISAQWAQTNLEGIAPAWHKNANVGHALDLWLLNLLPQSKPFEYNSGGYQTINFIPSIVTMLFGLMCGQLLRARMPAWKHLLVLVVAGIAGLALGTLLDTTGISPSIKRIWSPGWTLYSTGWCCLILAGLYAVVDVLKFRWWTFPLVVVGVNSIAIYCMGMLLKPWAARTWKTHFGNDVFLVWGPLWEPMVQACLVGLLFWLACWWMYRQKIFVRI